MKKTILAAALAAIGFSSTASATNYVSAGYFDFADSDFYVSGAFMPNENLRLGATAFDVIEGYGLRVTGDFLYEATPEGGLFGRVGVSHYDFGNTTIAGQPVDFGDDTGFVVGGGVAVFLDDSDLDFYATYDTALDGHFSVGGRYAFHLTNSFSVELGYAWNSNSIDNEFRLGALFRF